MSRDDVAARTIQPTLRPRLEFLGCSLAMLLCAAAGLLTALTRGRQLLDPESELELGALEPVRTLIGLLPWGIVVVSLLVAAWCAWAVTPASRRLAVVLDGTGLTFRPFMGRRVRVGWDRVREVEERPARGLAPAQLRIHHGRRRRPLKLLPLDYRAIRDRVTAAADTPGGDAAGA